MLSRLLGLSCFTARLVLAGLCVFLVAVGLLTAFDAWVCVLTAAVTALAWYLLVESFGLRGALLLIASSPALAIRFFPCVLVGLIAGGILLTGAALLAPVLLVQFVVWRLCQ